MEKEEKEESDRREASIDTRNEIQITNPKFQINPK